MKIAFYRKEKQEGWKDRNGAPSGRDCDMFFIVLCATQYLEHSREKTKSAEGDDQIQDFWNGVISNDGKR